MSGTAQLLLQLIVILATARVCGWVLRFLGQPAVIGEMLAGLLLGPVVFGRLFPQVHADLFPRASLEGLSSLSTLGLVMFMFVVGLETRPQQGLRAQLKAAGCVGVLSVITPLLLALGISPLLYPDLAPAGVAFWPFALFMAAALSVTAFPVMARILKDRGLTQTRVGQLSLSAAAVVDVFAWILLAVVVELVRASGSYWDLLVTILGVVAMMTCLVQVAFAHASARRRANPGDVGGAGYGAAERQHADRLAASACRVWRIFVWGIVAARREVRARAGTPF